MDEKTETTMRVLANSICGEVLRARIADSNGIRLGSRLTDIQEVEFAVTFTDGEKKTSKIKL